MFPNKISLEDIQNAEVNYLKKLLLIEKQSINDLIKTPEYLLKVARFHTCTRACGPFKSLKKGERFYFDNRYWIASGFVFLCPKSGKVHLCGLDACIHAITSSTCSTITCTLTNLDLGVGETLARTRNDRDVFIAGNVLVSSYVLSNKTEGVTESQMTKRIGNTVDKIQEAFESNNHRILSSIMNDDPSSSSFDNEEDEPKKSSLTESSKFRINQRDNGTKKNDFSISMEEIAAKEYEFMQSMGDDTYCDTETVSMSSMTEDNEDIVPKRKRSQAKKTVQRTVPTASSQRFSITPISIFDTSSSVYQDLLTLANKREEDVLDITRRFPFLDISTIRTKIQRRVLLRNSATSVWDVYAVTQSHLDTVEAGVRKATIAWREFVMEYYKECELKEVLPDKLHIIKIYKLDVLSKYEGVFYGGNVAEINDKARPHIINYMIKMWERFEEIPSMIVSKIPFDMCCTALLHYMKTGWKVDVYLLRNDPKPKICGNMTISQQSKAVSKTIMFIEPHVNLILKDVDHVRRGMTADKKKKLGKVVRPIGGKPVYSSRQRASSGGKAKNFSQIIPSSKNLNTVLEIVIDSVSSVQELEKYSLSYILRN